MDTGENAAVDAFPPDAKVWSTMGQDSRKHNKDYYNVAGRSGGPAGPLHQFKDQLAQEKAVLRRDEEHRIPGEKPPQGTRRKPKKEQASHRESVLDHLPKPPGAAGVPSRMKPLPTEEAAPPHYEVAPPSVVGEETGEQTFGVPASEEAALGHDREPFAREKELEEREPLSAAAERMIHRFPQAFRVLGVAARAIDEPVKRALDTLQLWGRAARKPR